ncbi:MAG: dihydrofolate reductase family protein, partial [Actinomycetes bacterium]
MRQLLPSALDVQDLAFLISSDERPAHIDRPWLLANMVSSVDGAVAVDGRSGALGGEPDAEMFGAVRSVPDAILVGAGTARAERYRRPQPGPNSARRRSRGQSDAPALAVVTNSGWFPDDQPFFGGDGPPPM